MSALHWICALTLALVCCLSAQPVKRHADEKSLERSLVKKEIFPRLDNFTKFTKNNCPDDTKMYTPTDIHKGCLSSALNCVKMELLVLKEECNLNEDIFDNLYTELDYAETETSPSSSSCQACELYPEQDAQQFLKAIRDLVERW
ncbi:hypothetical protein R3I94_013258 [Phoxinus phoxinus]|uniref:Interleukin n=1 Tax=Phoxinus phoxinus TaxID=58324 RepID=A0AAN9CKT3_9TELE